MIRLLPLVAFLLLVLLLPIDPAEDAHIMFRYAENLAGGHGLVWNPGLPPVEGATEFLWTIILAGMAFLGAPLGLAAQILSGLCVLLTLMVMMRFVERDLTLPSWGATLAALPVALGPSAVHSRSGFGTALFMLFLTLMWISAYRLTESRRPKKSLDARMFAVTWLCLGLTRPEGTLLGAMTFLAIVLLGPSNRRQSLVKAVLFFFLLPGLVYFLARWGYYGWLLPNTFYAKQGGAWFHGTGLRATLVLAQAVLPLVALIGILPLLLSREERKRFMVLQLPLLLFPLLYLCIEQMQNIGYRFQFPVLPALCLATAWILRLVTQARPSADNRRLLQMFVGFWILALGSMVTARYWESPVTEGWIIGGAFALASVLAWLVSGRALKQGWPKVVTVILLVLTTSAHLLLLSTTGTGARYDHRVLIGAALRPWASRGHVMVSSEAGWLPNFSGWTSVDPVGLYDSHIAHHGLSEAYLDEVNPDLIMFHTYSSVWKEEWAWGDTRWNAMTQLLYRYAISRGYRRTAIVGSVGDCNWYFLNPECPDYAVLSHVLCNVRGVPYVERHIPW